MELVKKSKTNTENETNKTANDEPVFYGTKELARFFRCSIPTARDIMRRSDFPLLCVGNKMLVSKAALERWAMERRA